MEEVEKFTRKGQQFILLKKLINIFIMESTLFKNNITSGIHFVTTRWEEGETTTEDNFMEAVRTYTTFQIASFINIYWYPVLVPIGLIGNCLSFAVMIKPNNRKMSTCIYMAAISINDNIMMYVCIHNFLTVALHIHSIKAGECKFVAFTALFALQNCTYLILAMTVDKYIAIKWPHKAPIYSTPGRAKLTAVVVYICVFIYNVPHFFLSSVIGSQCLAYAISSVFSRVYSWLSFVLNAIIPFTLLIHMNYIIVKTVRNSRKMFGANDINTGMETRQKNMKGAENQVTIMLLLVTTLFLILLFPTYFRFIYLVFAKRDTPVEYAKSMLIYQITSKLYTTNSGLNFLLYCISGKKFRNDVKEILCCSSTTNCSSSGNKGGLQSSTSELSSIQTTTSG